MPHTDHCPTHGNPLCAYCATDRYGTCLLHYRPWCQPCVTNATGGVAVAPDPARLRAA